MTCLSSRRAAAILLAGTLALLSGCGPGKNQFPPACPRTDLLWEAADISRYRVESAVVNQDIRDLVLSGRIIAVPAKCREGDSRKQVDADVGFTMQLTRGPAMEGREVDVPYFLAVTEDGRILDKKIYPAHLVFPPNVDQITWNSDGVRMVFPVSATKSAAVYTVLAGFQLTADELAVNRRLRVGQP
jgi:hypothetical protein